MIGVYIIEFNRENYKYCSLIIALGVSDFLFSLCNKYLAFLLSLGLESEHSSILCTVQGVIQQFSFNMSTFVVLHFTLFFYFEIIKKELKFVVDIWIGLMLSTIISVSISFYFALNNKIVKEGFWCFMSHKDAFFETLILVNGVYFVCLLVTIYFNCKTIYHISHHTNIKARMTRFKYLPFLQIMFFPIIIFSTVLYFYESRFIFEGITIGAILSSLNGVLNGIFYGFNKGNRNDLIKKLCGHSNNDIETPLALRSN